MASGRERTDQLLAYRGCAVKTIHPPSLRIAVKTVGPAIPEAALCPMGRTNTLAATPPALRLRRTR